MQSIPRQTLLRIIFAAVVSLALSIALLWPVPIRMGDVLVGHPGNDTWNHVWGYWWVGEALKAGEWPVRADLLAWPDGGSLYFIDSMQAIASWPVQLLFGPVVAYNLVILLQLAFCGFAAWILTWRLTGDWIAAFAALFFFELSPHLLGQAYNGISETVCAGWFPLTLWALLRMMNVPSARNAFLLGLVGGICILTSWYYGLFAALGALVLLIWSGLRQAWLYDWKGIAKGLGLAAATAGSIAIGPFLAFRSSLSASDALVSRDPAFVERSLLNHNITDVAAFFHFTKTPSPDLFRLYGEELIIVIYLGWVAILLSFYALYSYRKSRDLSPWLWLGAIFFVFSLGPYLNLGGEYVMSGSKRIPLPFLPLYKAFPVFDRISHPFRFVVGVNLALSIVAAHGFRRLLKERSDRTRICAVFLLCICIWSEYSLGSPARLPVAACDASISSAYSEIRSDSSEGAVLDLPMTLPNLERAVYVWNQSEHGRPVPWGLNDPMPAKLLQNRLTATLIQIESTRAQILPALLPELDLVVASRALVRQGYSHIVVHERLFPRYKRDHTVNLLNALYGEPSSHEEDGLLVYRLGL
jgi:hypothetical protein